MEEKELIQKLSAVQSIEVDSNRFRRDLRLALIEAQNDSNCRMRSGTCRRMPIYRRIGEMLVARRPAWQMLLAGMSASALIAGTVVVPVIAEQAARPVADSPVAYTFNYPFPEKNDRYDALKREMGSLWVPSYLPNGFALVSTEATEGFKCSLRYESGIGNSNVLTIIETPRVSPGGLLAYPAEHTETLIINGIVCYLVRGGWVVPPNRAMLWDEGASTQLYFNVGGWMILLIGAPGTKWVDDILIQVAGSMFQY